MQRIASRVARVLALAAVPVLVAGCSAGSDSGSSGSPDDKSTNGGSASASLAPAKYAELPNPCQTLKKSTVQDLVPKAKDLTGDAPRSTDLNARASCSWNGLDGFQYRWLDVSLKRFDSVEGLGSAEAQAKAGYDRLKQQAQTPDGLKKDATPSARAVPRLGDEAWLVSAEVNRDHEDYRDVAVLARTSNVVLVVSYDGAGFEDGKTPKAGDIESGAVRAAREALTAVGRN